MPINRVRVVTFGGSDSSGGAGIQADLKTFSALGVYGASIITAVTAQNSRGVQSKLVIPAELLNSQIRSVMDDIGPVYAKTGLLPSPDTVETVAAAFKEYRVPFVLDPVIKAGSGTTLMEPRALDTLVQQLLPLCRVVTPNLPEATAISGMEIRTATDMRDAAIAIRRMGAPAVIIKGGHFERGATSGRAIDLIYDGDEFHELELEYIAHDVVLHGCGCSFSAALTAELAKGLDLYSAAVNAKEFVHYAISYSDTISWFKVANPAHRIRMDADRYRVLNNVKEAVKQLKRMKNFRELIPEVGTNIGMAIECASDENDVAAVDGRIRATHEGIHAGCVEFGVSSHVARMILTMMRFEPANRSAINIRYRPELVTACENAGLVVSHFERAKEPPGMETMVWGIKEAIAGSTKMPEVIFDRGAYGKEAMIRIFGTNAINVVKKLRRVLN